MIYKGRELDVAWAAGFLDGEGCFTITASRARRQLSPRVVAAQIDDAPLYTLQRLFGGSVVKSSAPVDGRRQLWTWEVYGAAACRVILPELIPFLVVKRAQAELLLEYSQRINRRGIGRGHKLSDDELGIREVYAESLADMKR